MTLDPLETFAAHFDAVSAEDAMIVACQALRARAGQLGRPVALAPILRGVGAELVRTASLRAEGALQTAGEQFQIVVPGWDGRRGQGGTGWRRQRFTIAHEIGHIILLRSLPPGARAEVAHVRWHQRVERLCNLAAAELLMPRAAVVADLCENGFSPSGLRTLYDDYLVSWAAMIVRIAEVCGGSATVWRSGVRIDDGDTLRVTQSFGRREGHWLPPGLSERYLSQPVVRVALRDDVASCRELRSAHTREQVGSAALACRFPSYRADQSRLPHWRGRTIPDDRAIGDDVVLLRLATGRSTIWDAMRRSPSIDGPREAVTPAPLGR